MNQLVGTGLNVGEPRRELSPFICQIYVCFDTVEFLWVAFIGAMIKGAIELHFNTRIHGDSPGVPLNGLHGVGGV